MRVIGEDFTTDIAINKLKLEEECSIQPMLYEWYGNKYAEARGNKDKAKDRLDLILSQKDLYYRRNPPTDIKATEAVYASLVAIDTDVLIAKEEYQKASQEVYSLDIAINVLDQRKSELDNLVQLWTKSYYSGNIGMNDIEARKGLVHKEGQ